MAERGHRALERGHAVVAEHDAEPDPGGAAAETPGDRDQRRVLALERDQPLGRTQPDRVEPEPPGGVPGQPAERPQRPGIADAPDSVRRSGPSGATRVTPPPTRSTRHAASSTGSASPERAAGAIRRCYHPAAGPRAAGPAVAEREPAD